MADTSEMAGGGGACGKQARPAPQGAKPVQPCRVSHAAAAWRKARAAGPQAAAAERPGGAGNIFAPCVISGSSTRKRALGGKIRAPCILNRPIAPGNGCMGRGCCHLDLEKHAFRADVARKGAFSRIRRKRDACGAILASQGPGADATREGDAGGGARRARCVGVGGSYSLKLAIIAATRSFSASMSCWFTSSIFCKSAGEAFST